MSPLTIRCVRAAFVFLALGIGLGVTFAIDRAIGARLRPLHAELNLWGWATLLIYGMGYHMLPRFSGHPLRDMRLANLQSWLAIIGCAAASIGWIGVAASTGWGRPLLAIGTAAQAAAAILFAAQIAPMIMPPRRA